MRSWSKACSSCASSQAKKYVRDMRDFALTKDIHIFGIAFGSDADQVLIQEITTNGNLYYAPTPEDLTGIYNEIAETISQQSFSTPKISSANPPNVGWQTNIEYTEDTSWQNGVCSGKGVSCMDFRQLLQSNIDACTSDPCKISFSVSSSTAGRLDLSELNIETQKCGNGIIESGEECDDGTGSKQCSVLCKLTYCGDGIVQNPDGKGVNEFCDDGPENSKEGKCNSACSAITPPLKYCGDDITQSDLGEECDDGNTIDSDACSNSCSINFKSQCNQPVCNSCFPSPTYDCLRRYGCLEKKFSVNDPYIWITPSKDLSVLLDKSNTILSFYSLDPDFQIINPKSYLAANSWRVIGLGDAEGYRSAAVVIADTGMRTVRFCPELERVYETAGEEVTEPETDLLITKSRAVIGYYEQSGGVVSTGPYIFTAKVWLRK
jgi:cysteine-rich repeat protein